jgi:hypothetical protein
LVHAPLQPPLLELLPTRVCLPLLLLLLLRAVSLA